jgi:hypothetical protein
MASSGKLQKIRPYRERIAGTEKVSGLRFTAGCAETIRREAERKGLSVSAVIEEVLEDWYSKGGERDPK